MKSILVSHPHAKADAQQVATALDAAGMLAVFLTGLAVSADSWSARCLLRAGRFRRQMANRVMSGIDPRRLRSLAAVEIGARAAGGLAARIGRRWPDAYDCMYLAHDAAVAAACWPREVDGVYAYEDAALRTFRRAARLGIARVWDLPTPRYQVVERLWKTEAERWPEAMGARPLTEPAWKKRRKDAELSLATHISVASQFTRASLEGLDPRVPVYVLPYGFPVEAFPCKERIADGPFTAIAVGSQSVRKGTHYLLEAWKRAALTDARLRLIGLMDLAPAFFRQYRDLVEHVPHLPKADLIAEYHAADVLVFPTLGDGFGMVIQEAMCCGTPVITTRCGGGPECIDDGANGWIVPDRDVDALVEQLRAAASDRQRTFEIGQAARRRAQQYTWKEAGAALASSLGVA